MTIRYLNGGLFLPHIVEQRERDIVVPDRAFENLSTSSTATPGISTTRRAGNDDEINPDVLGYIFEKYINQKAFGAYYTPPEITEYLCERHDSSADSRPDQHRRAGIPGVNGNAISSQLADLLMDARRSTLP